MHDYTINSKNRKFKKRVLSWIERLNFGAGKLPLSGKIILILDCILLSSVFFPWLHFSYVDESHDVFSAFSVYTGFSGYWIVLSVILIPFFLLSHEKKEKIRWFIPFRLSDAQAIVFIASMILVTSIHQLFISLAFARSAQIDIGAGFLLAVSSVMSIIFTSHYFSRQMKIQGVELQYLDHHDVSDIDDYRQILEQGSRSKQTTEKEKNMTLPI